MENFNVTAQQNIPTRTREDLTIEPLLLENFYIMKAMLRSIIAMQNCLIEIIGKEKHVFQTRILKQVKAHCDNLELTVMDELERYEGNS